MSIKILKKLFFDNRWFLERYLRIFKQANDLQHKFTLNCLAKPNYAFISYQYFDDTNIVNVETIRLLR